MNDPRLVQVAGCSWTMPVLWCAAFDRTEVHTVPLKTDWSPLGGETKGSASGLAATRAWRFVSPWGASQPDQPVLNEGVDEAFVLVTPLATARQRAIQDRDTLFALFPREKVTRVYEEWLRMFDVLAPLEALYLHFLISELAALYDDGALRPTLDVCLGPLSHKSDEQLEILLRQTGIDFDRQTRQACPQPNLRDTSGMPAWDEIGYDLHGYAYLDALGWEE